MPTLSSNKNIAFTYLFPPTPQPYSLITHFVLELIQEFATQSSNNTIHIITNQPDHFNNSPHNTQVIPLTIKSFNTQSILYWYYHKLPKKVSPLKLNYLIHTNGIASPSIKCPQIATLLHPSFWHIHTKSTFQQILPNFLLLPLLKAVTLYLTPTHHINAILNKKFKSLHQPIQTLPPFALSPFQPLDGPTIQTITNQLTNGNQYFLFHSSLITTKSATHLLKAFSIFKKWQQSAMHLAIITNDAQVIHQLLTHYKYRNDVIVHPSPQLPTLSQWIAASYALILLEANDYITSFAAIQSHIPLLAPNNPITKEWVAENAFYTTDDSFDALGQQMISCYKNETLRTNIITRAQSQLQIFNKSNTLHHLLSALQNINQS